MGVPVKNCHYRKLDSLDFWQQQPRKFLTIFGAVGETPMVHSVDLLPVINIDSPFLLLLLLTHHSLLIYIVRFKECHLSVTWMSACTLSAEPFLDAHIKEHPLVAKSDTSVYFINGKSVFTAFASSKTGVTSKISLNYLHIGVKYYHLIPCDFWEVAHRADNRVGNK